MEKDDDSYTSVVSEVDRRSTEQKYELFLL
jgi:hypothetical protein